MKVFCCEGWKQPRTVRPPRATSTPWPKRGRGRGVRRGRRPRGTGRPRPTRTSRGRRPRAARAAAGTTSRSIQGAQVSRSSGRGLVLRRGAAHGGDDPGAAQLEAVVEVGRGRLVGQADAVQRGEQPVAGAVTGEDPPGAVGAVGGRRQADDQHARVGGAPAGDRAAPVRLPGVRRPLLARHLLAPAHQPWARPALADPLVDLGQRGARGQPGHAARRARDRNGHRRPNGRSFGSPGPAAASRISRCTAMSLACRVSVFWIPRRVAHRELERLLGRDTELQLAAALELGVELGAEHQRQVGDPQPQQGDDDAGDGAVGLVVGAEAARRSRRSRTTRPARPGSPRTTRPR